MRLVELFATSKAPNLSRTSSQITNDFSEAALSSTRFAVEPIHSAGAVFANGKPSVGLTDIAKFGKAIWITWSGFDMVQFV